MIEPQTSPTRQQLAVFIKDPRTLLAFEALLKNANLDLVNAVNEAQADATAAAALAEALRLPTYIVQTLNTTLTNERALTAANGVAFDFATAGQVKITVNVVSILGYTPVNPALAVHLLAGLNVDGQTETDTLKIDQTPAVSTATVTHSLPIETSAGTYYLILSSTP